MAAATNTITTTATLSTLMRQVQTKAYKAANFGFDASGKCAIRRAGTRRELVKLLGDVRTQLQAETPR